LGRGQIVSIRQESANGIGRRVSTYRPGWIIAGFCLALAVVAPLVVLPLITTLFKSFASAPTGTADLDNWQRIFTEPRNLSAIGTIAALATTRQAIALVIGGAIACLIARTNFPGKHWLELGFWVTLFLPTITATLGRVALFDGPKG